MSDDDLRSQFENWLQSHGAAVLKIARAYALTTEDCQDLAQEILLQCWCSLPQFQKSSSLATWFYRVALNTALNWRRGERRRSARRIPFFEFDGLSATATSLEYQTDQNEKLRSLYDAIRRLPQTDAALIVLYLDELTYRQIAEILGITENNVGVKLNRVKRELAERLQEKSNDA